MADNTSMPSAVQVVASTWARDSHDLYDFEARQYHTKTLTVQKQHSCAERQGVDFVRSGTDVQMLSEYQEAAPGADPLLSVVQRDGHFWVDKPSSSPNKDKRKLWQVVRGGRHTLSEGDIIKLGRFKFRVRQLVASAIAGTQPDLSLVNDAGAPCCVDSSKTDELSSTTCRICLMEGSGEDDPLIRPCQCKGSIEYVHLGCLRHWIGDRMNVSETQHGSYYYRPLSCELCKTPYASHMMADQKQIPLVEVPQTQPPFVVLENMVRDSHQHSSRGLHVASLAEKALKIGRGHDCGVVVKDVSMSRWHATISFDHGQFILEDNNSKFGTLVAMKKPRRLDESNPISIQLGRTVLSLSVSQQGAAEEKTALGTASGAQMSDRERSRSPAKFH